MRFFSLILFVLLQALILAAPIVAASVTGTIIYRGKVPSLPPIAMDSDPGCAKKHSEPVAPEILVLGKGQTLGNVFVQLKGLPPRDYPAPKEPVVIDQIGCLYVPRVVGALVGQTVLFKNSDGLMHNVHGLPKVNSKLNIAMPPVFKEAKRSFAKPEPLFPVKCDVHPWMNSYLAVMTHPYFAVTSKDGRYEIRDVPPGEYRVEVWHEKLGIATLPVKVGAAGAEVDFTLKVPDKK